jgi:hypothetical protein
MGRTLQRVQRRTIRSQAEEPNASLAKAGPKGQSEAVPERNEEGKLATYI